MVMESGERGKLILPGRDGLSGSTQSSGFFTNPETSTNKELDASKDPALILLTDRVRQYESGLEALGARINILEESQRELTNKVDEKKAAEGDERQLRLQGARLLKLAFWVQIISLAALSGFLIFILASHWAPSQWSKWLTAAAGFVGLGGFAALARFIWKLSKIGDRLMRIEEKLDIDIDGNPRMPNYDKSF